MLNRWVEADGPKQTLHELGIGSIAFTARPGHVDRKYLNGEPKGSRATQGKSPLDGFLNDKTLAISASLMT